MIATQNPIVRHVALLVGRVMLTALLLCTGCTSDDKNIIEPTPLPTPELSDGRVSLTLHTGTLQQPNHTRASTENIDPNKDVWVLIFDGAAEDNAAIFRQICYASNPIPLGGGKYRYTFIPPVIDTPVRLLILANAPDSVLLLPPPYEMMVFGSVIRPGNNSTPIAFSEANLNAALAGKSYAEAVNTLLNAPMLGYEGSDRVTFDPNEEIYQKTADYIPMGTTVDRDGISPGISIGTENAPVKLTRCVAKVSVTNMAPNFKLQFITTHGTPMNGSYFPTVDDYKRDNHDNVGHYIGGGIFKYATPDSGVPQVATDLYLYEYSFDTIKYDAKKENYPLVVIHGVYTDTEGKATQCFYSFAFPDSKIKRNTHYNFIIKAVDAVGKEGLFALGYDQPISNSLKYRVDITDHSSHDIQCFADSYLGFSYSEATIYHDGAVAIDLTTVNTNANFRSFPLSLTHDGAAHPSNGITRPTSLSIPVAGFFANEVSYPISVTLNSDVQTATLSVSYPPMLKQIPIVKHPSISINGAHITDFVSSDYIYAELADPADAAWVGLSATASPPTDRWSRLENYTGGIHLYVDPNTTGAARTANLSLSRRSYTGRMNVLLTQSGTHPPTLSAIAATRGTPTDPNNNDFKFTLTGTFAKGSVAITEFGWEMWSEIDGQILEVVPVFEPFGHTIPITTPAGQTFTYEWESMTWNYITRNYGWSSYTDKAWLRVYVIDANGTKWYDTSSFGDAMSVTFPLVDTP